MDDKEKQALIQAALATEVAGRKALLRNPFEGLMPKRLDVHRFPIQPLPHPAIIAFYDQPLRKCDECGCTGCHEPVRRA